MELSSAIERPIAKKIKPHNCIHPLVLLDCEVVKPTTKSIHAAGPGIIYRFAVHFDTPSIAGLTQV